MRIVLLCATDRGLRVLRELRRIAPEDDITVVSFREEPGEPPFLDRIRRVALALGAVFHEARSVGGDAAKDIWSLPVDLLLAVSWRYIVPTEVFERPRMGSFVFHDSLLPEYRGFSPTVWAIANGEDHTGVTLFRMATEVDTGDILDQRRVEIGPDETIATVLDRVTETYVAVLRDNLAALKSGVAPERPQSITGATYSRKRTAEDDRIDWSRPTAEIYNLIRAVTAPYRGARTSLGGRGLRVWAARREGDPNHLVAAGTVVDVRQGEGVCVATGDGSIVLTQVQLDGDGRISAEDLSLSVGTRLGP